MLLHRNAPLKVLVALLVVCATLVLSLGVYHGGGFLFLALLPAFLGLVVSFTEAFPLSPRVLAPVAQPAPTGRGSRAPPAGLRFA
jgi:hypothetical protein